MCISLYPREVTRTCNARNAHQKWRQEVAGVLHCTVNMRPAGPSAMSTYMHSDLCTPVYTWEHACVHTQYMHASKQNSVSSRP